MMLLLCMGIIVVKLVVQNSIDTAKVMGVFVESMNMLLIIPRYCNNCGKHFSYRIGSGELHQQKEDIEYLCDECLYEKNYPPSQTYKDKIAANNFRILGNYDRLDKIWKEKHEN